MKHPTAKTHLLFRQSQIAVAVAGAGLLHGALWAQATPETTTATLAPVQIKARATACWAMRARPTKAW